MILWMKNTRRGKKRRTRRRTLGLESLERRELRAGVEMMEMPMMTPDSTVDIPAQIGPATAGDTTPLTNDGFDGNQQADDVLVDDGNNTAGGKKSQTAPERPVKEPRIDPHVWRRSGAPRTNKEYLKHLNESMTPSKNQQMTRDLKKQVKSFDGPVAVGKTLIRNTINVEKVIITKGNEAIRAGAKAIADSPYTVLEEGRKLVSPLTKKLIELTDPGAEKRRKESEEFDAAERAQVARDKANPESTPEWRKELNVWNSAKDRAMKQFVSGMTKTIKSYDRRLELAHKYSTKVADRAVEQWKAEQMNNGAESNSGRAKTLKEYEDNLSPEQKKKNAEWIKGLLGPERSPTTPGNSPNGSLPGSGGSGNGGNGPSIVDLT